MTQTPNQVKHKRYNDKRSRAGYWHSEKFRELERKAGRRLYARRKKYLLAYAKAHPERIAARKAVKEAIEGGLLEREPCLCCGKSPAQAHHWKGYEKQYWLDVIWLCQQHHHD